ncbi:hypothetical protein [Peptostreptococcus sp.]|uniref:hypothetical protein n=1 Tax=Peptostreptococcus sp. TaxID=1262 RepID=UPI001CACB202|nr:hypothetical protein [Peptostreptococcus sp.]MBF1049742.1 hypothetical protein [Peptostreptococcus sp.]
MKTGRIVLAIYISVLSLVFQRTQDRFVWDNILLNFVPIILIVIGIFIEIILITNNKE